MKKAVLLLGLVLATSGGLPAFAQLSVGGGAGTGHGAPGVNVQSSHLRGSVGVNRVGGDQYIVWEASYVSIEPDTTDVFFWRVGGGVVGARSVRGEVEEKYLGGSGLLMYDLSLTESVSLNLGAGVTVAEEELPLVNSQVFPALEATLDLQL